MALVVEDGSIVAGADSYATVAAFDTYATSMGWTLLGDTAGKEASMRRAYAYLNREYTYKGTKVDQDQTGQWPRYIDDLIDGFAILASVVPVDIVNAQYEIAFLFDQGEDLFAYTSGGSVKREKVKAGPVESETEYESGSGAEARLLAVEGLLRPYVTGGQPGQTVTFPPMWRS